MNCTKIEKEVYLYDALTEEERAVVDKHILHCEACKKLFDMAQAHQSLIRAAAGDKPRPENYSRLTSNIMQAIEITPERRGLPHFFERLLVRYVFAGVSLMLITLFFVEQQTEARQPHGRVTVQSGMTTLKTSGMLEAFQKSKRSKTETSLYACVKSGDCNPFLKTLN